MSQTRQATPTVTVLDQYCAQYRHLFADVRLFDAFTALHLGLLADIPRKSLPAIAKAVGLPHSQGLHHLLTTTAWSTQAFHDHRLRLTKQLLADRPIIVCIDETGDRKKGSTTDYTARQYLGNVGKIDHGIVTVHAYGVLHGITFPLSFRTFKPKSRLQDGDEYKTKPMLAAEILTELVTCGFQIACVVADCAYGESYPFLDAIAPYRLPYIFAIRRNHGGWLPEDQRIEWYPWQEGLRHFADGTTEQRFFREFVYGQQGQTRYYQLTTDPTTLPEDTTWLIMAKCHHDDPAALLDGYGVRTWIEYSFRQLKQELGWKTYRLTAAAHIERWWEIVLSVYWFLSARALPAVLQDDTPTIETQHQRHRWWDHGRSWKAMLNNLRLIVQPFVLAALLAPWLDVFPNAQLQVGLTKLCGLMNQFQ